MGRPFLKEKTMNIKYFLKNHDDEIITIPAPASFTDEEGNVVQMQVKILSQERIQEIRNMYKKRAIATDGKGNPLIANGEVVWKTENDPTKAFHHIVAEAIVYPNLTDQELMEFYKCFDITQIILKVFHKTEDYNYVTKAVLTALGLLPEIEDQNEEVDKAKN